MAPAVARAPIAAPFARDAAPRTPAGAPIVAAVSLSVEAGGIAAVSRMCWQVLQTAWPAAELVTLFRGPVGVNATRPGLGAQLSFGLSLMRREMARDDAWVFLNHMALGRAQAFMPPAVRRPYVLFLHGIEAWASHGPDGLRVIRDAALLVSNSQHTASRVRTVCPDAGAIAVCPLALPDEVLAASASAEPALRAPMVLMVGRMLAAERYKGHDQMLDAWGSVRRAVPTARLVIVGGGDDVPRLQQRASDLGLADAVTFTGFVSDAERARLYREASLFAMPSRGEGFGLVYLEAMAHELPCLASRQDAGQEVVRDGVTGYAVDQEDVPTLASRVIELLTDPVRRQAMGRAGRRLVASEHSSDRFAARLLSLIGSAADRLSPKARS